MGPLIWRVRRHDIRHVAHDEQLAGRASNITSGDTRELQHPITMICGDIPAFAKVAIAILFVPQTSDEKGPIAVDELLRKCHALRLAKDRHLHSHNHGSIAVGNPRPVPGVARAECMNDRLGSARQEAVPQ